MTYHKAKDMLGSKDQCACFFTDSFVGLKKRPAYIEMETARFNCSAKVPIAVVAIFPSNKVKTIRTGIVDLTAETTGDSH